LLVNLIEIQRRGVEAQRRREDKNSAVFCFASAALRLCASALILWFNKVRNGFVVRRRQCPLSLCASVSLWFASTASAHVGSPTVFFEGMAGPHQVRVVVRPPGVVPGLAEISVRVLNGTPSRVTALPVRWDAGTKGAPSPDVLQPVRGDTNHFSGELWLMTHGSFSIFVDVEGPKGQGATVVPLNSVATSTKTMPRFFGAGLLAFAGFLVLALGTLAGAAVRESTLPPGVAPDGSRRIKGAMAVVVAFVVSGVMLWGGQKWWTAVDSEYRNNKLYQPDPVRVSAHLENGQLMLRMERLDGRWGRRPLVPEHGKLVHAFLIRSNDMSAFAHLHPVQSGRNIFQSVLPALPEGRYHFYADVTHESGFTQTLVSHVEIPNLNLSLNPTPTPLSDPDDSWHAGGPAPDAVPLTATLSSKAVSAPLENAHMIWVLPDRLVANEEVALKFRVLGSDTNRVAIEPYMGMQAHAVIQHEDATVFTHLHPFGTVSMAAQERFVSRERQVAPNRRTLEIVCGLPSEDESITFPYAFPKPGRYRIWVQVKIAGKIQTAVFDANVLPPS
jgi:hypothetical protein